MRFLEGLWGFLRRSCEFVILHATAASTVGRNLWKKKIKEGSPVIIHFVIMQFVREKARVGERRAGVEGGWWGKREKQ